MAALLAEACRHAASAVYRSGVGLLMVLNVHLGVLGCVKNAK